MITTPTTSATTTTDDAPYEVRIIRIVHRPLRLFSLGIFVILQILFRIPQPSHTLFILKVAAIAGFLGSLVPFRRRYKNALLRVDAAWIFVDGQPLVRRDQLTHVVARGGGVDARDRPQSPAVLLGRPFGPWTPIDVHLSTRADADALVAALGGGVHQHIAIFFVQERSASRFRLGASSLFLVLVLAVLFRGPYRALLVPFITVVILPIVTLMQRRRIVVGGDGISIEPAVPFLAKRTFVPFASLDGVLRKDARATLIIDGQPRSFSLPKRKGRKEPYAATTAFIARIEEAGARYAKSTAANTDARILTGMLARDGRPLGAWLDAVRSNVHLGPSHRRLAVEPDRLLTMAEDPAVDGDVRAAAAVVLAEVPDPDVQERLRAAANVTAEPALRRVLELATHPDESGLFDALDDVPRSRRFGEEDVDSVRDEVAPRDLLDVATPPRDKTGPR